MPHSVTARAHPNIALIKYWGKRDAVLNLPAQGSISVTLDQLATTTSIELTEDAEQDAFSLNGEQDPARAHRALELVDRMRKEAGRSERVRVTSGNNFPTAAGLASSASGFAALVTACDALFEMGLSDADRSAWARQGSGSAARSIFGDFVEMARGEAPDGRDAVAAPLAAASALPLATLVAVTSTASKAQGSGPGMESSRKTSPFYSAWVSSTGDDLEVARDAILSGDFAALADVSIASCMKMHATMLATTPPLIYWRPGTLAVIHAVESMRSDGVPLFYTIDAGPQVKVFCPPDEVANIKPVLAKIESVIQVLELGPGPAASVRIDRP